MFGLSGTFAVMVLKEPALLEAINLVNPAEVCAPSMKRVFSLALLIAPNSKDCTASVLNITVYVGHDDMSEAVCVK